MGPVINQASDLHFQLSQRYHVDLADVPAITYAAHKVFVEELNKKERDDDEKSKQSHRS